jgi:coenzyme PQQ precursor peptide PqqA
VGYAILLPSHAETAPPVYLPFLIRRLYNAKQYPKGRTQMAWTTPLLVEVCIGLEINGYLPAEF